MQVKVVGGGNLQAGVELGIDPTFQAARVSIKPLDYANLGDVLGHYRIAFSTSAIAPASAAIMASLRWSDPSRFLVLMRVVISVTVATAVTAQRTDPLTLRLQRAYTASETTNVSNQNLSGDNQKLRSSTMESSLVSQIAAATAAAGISGGTRTGSGLISQMGVTGLGALGTGVQNVELYKWDVLGQHPLVLSTNEGFTVEWGGTALATGTITVNFIFEWAEVSVF